MDKCEYMKHECAAVTMPMQFSDAACVQMRCEFGFALPALEWFVDRFHVEEF
jgi:hypothetical protein